MKTLGARGTGRGVRDSFPPLPDFAFVSSEERLRLLLAFPDAKLGDLERDLDLEPERDRLREPEDFGFLLFCLPSSLALLVVFVLLAVAELDCLL